MTTATSAAHQRLEAVVRHRGRVATVVVPEPDASEDLAERLEMMAERVRRELTEAGAPESVVARVADVLVERVPSDFTGGLGVVADAERVTVQTLGAPREAVTAAGSLPRMVPFVRDVFEQRPHVVARCDRTGAEIATVLRGQVLADVSVDGDEQHVQKVSQGGWSQPRLQRHSEHTWEQNAKDIVAGIVTAAEAIDADVIVATGDERAVQLVAEHLPEHWRDRLATDDFQPTDPDTEAEVFDRAATVVADRVAEELVELLQRFAEARGRGEGAADGTEDVLTALRRGAVDTLLVGEDVDEPVTIALSDPMQVATDRSTLEALDLADLTEARSTDAAIVAALAGGARVVVVPEHGPDTPTGPLGALLRY